VFVALGIQRAKRMGHMACLRLCYIFPHYFLKGAIFGESYWKTKCVFWFSLQLCSKYFSF